MPAGHWILLAFLLTATESFQLPVNSLNAAGVAMEVSSSRLVPNFLPMKWVSEGGAWRSSFFPDPSCQCVHFGSLSPSILYTVSLFTSTPLKLWGAFRPLPVHLFLSGVYRVKLEEISATKGLGEQERIHSVLSWRGVGEDWAVRISNNYCLLDCSPLVTSAGTPVTSEVQDVKRLFQREWVYKSSGKVTPQQVAWAARSPTNTFPRSCRGNSVLAALLHLEKLVAHWSVQHLILLPLHSDASALLVLWNSVLLSFQMGYLRGGWREGCKICASEPMPLVTRSGQAKGH